MILPLSLAILTLSTVLNPAIRMSWIRRHWEEDYIVKAENKIRELVR